MRSVPSQFSLNSLERHEVYEMVFQVINLRQQYILTYKGKGELHPPHIFMLRLKLSLSKIIIKKSIEKNHQDI